MTEDFVSPFGTIFRESVEGSSPFVDPKWTVIPVVEWFPEETSSYFYPLVMQVRVIGDQTFMAAEDVDPPREFSSDEWTPMAFSRAIMGLPFGALIYGRSCQWGLVVTHEGFSVLGGERELIQGVTNELGGIAKLRDEFEQWLERAPSHWVPRERREWLSRLNRRR